ncbi:MAG TPA: alpha/beta hydrolase, partial [Acidimicrobiales bacterium]|nr:alpha/beta hydrolase [Acidimicrobiales bacterium]
CMGHQVLSVDQRGHGASALSAAGGPYDWNTLCADLLAVCRTAGWLGGSGGERKPVVAGQSWGASVVLEFARRHPEALEAAVLVDGGVGELAEGFADWPSCEAALMPPVFAGTPIEAMRHRLRVEHPDWGDEGVEDTLANLKVLADGTVSSWLPREDHRRILRLMWDHRPSMTYPAVQVPVLLVPAEPTGDSMPHGYGATGAIANRWLAMKREGVARAEKAIPNCATRWLAGDHDLHVQRPGAVAALIHQAAGGELP